MIRHTRCLSLAVVGATFGVLVAGNARAATNAAAAYQQSYVLEAQQDYNGALAALLSAPSAERNEYVYQLRSGWLCLLAGRYDDSVVAYRRAIGQAAGAVEPRLGLLLPLMAAHRWQDAVSEAEALLRLDAKSYLGRSRLAFALYSLGRFAAAESVYRAVLADYPADVEMLSGLGWAQLGQERRAEATRTFRAVLAFAPQTPSALEGHSRANGAK
ncbi:MAG: tetratricopeptide repeat protein [Myxococcota bacterium]